MTTTTKEQQLGGASSSSISIPPIRRLAPFLGLCVCVLILWNNIVVSSSISNHTGNINYVKEEDKPEKDCNAVNETDNGNKEDFIKAAQRVFFSHADDDALLLNDFTDPAVSKYAATHFNSNHSVFIHNATTPTKPVWLCTAPKTGCTGWAYFLLYVNNGILIDPVTTRNDPGVVHDQYTQQKESWSPKQMLVKDKHDNSSLLPYRFSRFPHYVVARNPYVRFVSSWKDWQFRTSKSNTTLADFLALYQSGEGGFLRDHVAPVSETCAVHRPLRYAAVLRVEEQALWMDAFLARYGLTELMKQYTDNGNVLFQSSVFDDVFENHHKQNENTTASSSFEQWIAAATGVQSWPGKMYESNHHRGSAQQVTRYYTPEIAAQVTQLFLSDFQNFRYPLWDGNRPDTFRVV